MYIFDSLFSDVDASNGSPPPKVTKVGRTVKVDSAKKITLNKSTSQEVVSVESDSGLYYIIVQCGEGNRVFHVEMVLYISTFHYQYILDAIPVHPGCT